MSQDQKQKQKELFEKLQELCKTKNDPELDAALEELRTTFAPATDDDGNGGNNPSVPDIP